MLLTKQSSGNKKKEYMVFNSDFEKKTVAIHYRLGYIATLKTIQTVSSELLKISLK